MRVDLFDFDLPETSIALRPAEPRGSARLLVVDPAIGLADRRVADLPGLLRPGDALVFNDTRVIPARLHGLRLRPGAPGQRMEAMLHLREAPDCWRAFARPAKRLAAGDRIRFGTGTDAACDLAQLDATVAAKGEGGEVVLRFDLAGPLLDERIAALGILPLPPTSRASARSMSGTRPTTRRSMPASPALSPRRPPACTSPRICWPPSTPPASNGTTSRCMSAPAPSCR